MVRRARWAVALVAVLVASLTGGCTQITGPESVSAPSVETAEPTPKLSQPSVTGNRSETRTRGTVTERRSTCATPTTPRDISLPESPSSLTAGSVAKHVVDVETAIREQTGVNGSLHIAVRRANRTNGWYVVTVYVERYYTVVYTHNSGSQTTITGTSTRTDRPPEVLAGHIQDWTTYRMNRHELRRDGELLYCRE